jgi:alpha-D-ribose 1-methylphosphonate 5-triphosphate synthase subunit PhnG
MNNRMPSKPPHDRNHDRRAVRREAMFVLACASADDLDRTWRDAEISVETELLRGPETGLVTVRGRIGGGGAAFNVGEATVTRATVRTGTGHVGHSYLLGRDAGRARIAATVDALMQDPAAAGDVESRVLAPLRTDAAAERRRKTEETAATRVDFFTLVRGEDR